MQPEFLQRGNGHHFLRRARGSKKDLRDGKGLVMGDVLAERLGTGRLCLRRGDGILRNRFRRLVIDLRFGKTLDDFNFA
jgi:hypothetical protein